MATYKYVDVDIDDAKYLADLNGAEVDLSSAIQLCNYLNIHFETGNLETEIIDALSTAILVRYARPFMSGVREKLNIDELDGLTRNDINNHNKYISFRSKHITHSVNIFEENQVVAYYNDEKVKNEGIQSISVQHHRVMGLSSIDLDNIIGLSKKVRKNIKQIIDSEKEKVLDIIRGIPIGEVLARGTKGPTILDMSKIDKRR